MHKKPFLWNLVGRPYSIGTELVIILLVFPGLYLDSNRFGELSTVIGVKLNYILIAIGVIILSIKLYRRKVTVSTEFVYILGTYALFMSLVMISLFWSLGGSYSKFKLLRLITLIPLLLVLTGFISAGSSRRTSRFIHMLYVFSIWVGVEGFWSLIFLETSVYGSLGSTNRIPVARLSGLAVLISIMYYFQSKKLYSKMFHVVAGCVCSYTLLMSGSRAPLLGLMGAMTIFAILMYYQKFGVRISPVYKQKPKFWILSPILPLAIIIPLSTTDIIESVYTLDRLTFIWTGYSDGSLSQRVEFYRKSVEFWILNPLLGNGVGSFSTLIGAPDNRMYPHNIFLELLVEFGVLGFVLFTIILLIGVRGLLQGSLRYKDLNYTIIFVVFCYLFANATVTGDILHNKFLLIILAFVGGSKKDEE